MQKRYKPIYDRRWRTTVWMWIIVMGWLTLWEASEGRKWGEKEEQFVWSLLHWWGSHSYVVCTHSITCMSIAADEVSWLLWSDMLNSGHLSIPCGIYHQTDLHPSKKQKKKKKKKIRSRRKETPSTETTTDTQREKDERQKNKEKW